MYVFELQNYENSKSIITQIFRIFGDMHGCETFWEQELGGI